MDMYVCMENTRSIYEGILAVDKFKIKFNHFRRRIQLIFIFIYFIKDVRNLLTFFLNRNEYVWGFSNIVFKNKSRANLALKYYC